MFSILVEFRNGSKYFHTKLISVSEYPKYFANPGLWRHAHFNIFQRQMCGFNLIVKGRPRKFDKNGRIHPVD